MATIHQGVSVGVEKSSEMIGVWYLVRRPEMGDMFCLAHSERMY